MHCCLSRSPEMARSVLLCHSAPCPPSSPGVLQVLLPELLALAAQHGRSRSPQPLDAEPEEPGVELGELVWPEAHAP